MGKIRAVIFDLDDVLYNEKDYVYAAYRAIAKFLSSKCGLSGEEIYVRLIGALYEKTGMYPRLFNDLLVNIGLGEELVPEVLRIYSEVDSELSLYPNVGELLNVLRVRGFKLGLLSNGTVKIQKNKVRLLGVEKFFDVVMYAREKGKEYDKPNPEAYRMVLERLGVSPKEAVCIGDNPYTDFWGARKLGMRTARFLAGEYQDVRLDAEYEADVNVNSLNEFLTFVEACDLGVSKASKRGSELRKVVIAES